MVDTITKVLKDADDKLKKAEALESKAVAVQKDATRLRDEADATLRQVRLERSNLDNARSVWEKEKTKSEDDLRNREKTLAAKQKDLEIKTTERNEEFVNREAMIQAKTAAVEKAEKENKLRSTLNDALDKKFKAIKDFITQTL